MASIVFSFQSYALLLKLVAARLRLKCFNYTFVVLLLMTNGAFAAQFIATASTTQLEVGQSLEINFVLKDAKAKEVPDFYSLAKDFTIYGQQQYSTFTSTNGAIKSESGWDLTVSPNHEGELVIPAIKILTDQGVISTSEIRILVNAASATSQKQPKNIVAQNATPSDKNDNNVGVSLIASVNKTSVYVKEPVIYTLKIVSHKPIMNVALDDIKSNDAIIDKIGEPSVYNQVLQGVRVHVIEVKYYVTPIVSGKINITPGVIRGEVQGPAQIMPSTTQYGTLNNFFFNDMVNFKPFHVRGEKITLTSLPPAVKGKDWLPLQNLSIREEWSGIDKAQVGDTIIRKIKMTAKGGYSNQLPSVQNFMDLDNIKTYADKPTLADDLIIHTDTIASTKEETFSLVPTQAGKITFPQVSVPWWNLQTKQIEYATLPARTIDILPGAAGGSSDKVLDFSATADTGTKTNSLITTIKNNKYVIAIIIGLIAIICAMLVAIVYLLRSSRDKKPKRVSKKATNQVRTLDDPIDNAAELRDHILLYANMRWGAPKNLTLNKLGTFLTDNSFSYDLEIYVLICREINIELYASGAVELPALLQAWEQLKDSVKKNKTTTVDQSNNDYINLNPT